MKLKISFLFLGLFLFSLSGQAQQCEAAKQETDTSCDQGELARIKQQLAITRAALEAKGSVNATALAELQKTTLQAEVDAGNLAAACQKAIGHCTKECPKEAAEKAANYDLIGSEQASKTLSYCTDANQKPQQVQKEAEEGKGSLAEAGPLIAAALQALTGMMNKETAQVDDCTPSATRSAAIIAADPACSTDVASTGSAPGLVSGDYRSSTGLLTGQDSLGTAEVPMGTPAKQELSKVSSSGGGGGLSGSGGGVSGAGAGSGAAAKTASKDDAPPAAGSNFGGGGGGKGGGGAGTKAAAAAASIYSRTAIDGEKQVQAAVDKAMQQRNPSSEIPGGISSALWLDNFAKVQRTIENERNTLGEDRKD